MEQDYILLNNELLKKEQEKTSQQVHEAIQVMEEKLKNEVPGQKRLYVHTGIYQGTYFESIEKLIEYIGFDWFRNVMILDYIGDFQGKQDVIRKTYVGDISYMTESNDRKSIYRGINSETEEPLWIEMGGDLQDDYEALQHYGVKLTKKQGEKPLQKVK